MRTNLNGWDVNTAQAALRAKYEEKFPRLVSALADVETEGLSKPLMVDISAHEYGAAEIKVLVVGQQTNTWYGEWSNLKNRAPGDAVVELLGLYRDFKLGADRYTTFWQYAHKFYRDLNPRGAINGFIWSNLVKMDRKARYPGWAIEERLNKSFDVLALEVQIAKPDVVIFFSGHLYDKRLKARFPGAQLSAVSNSGLDCKWLSIVEHELLPLHSYRTYHPNYQRRRRKGYSVVDKISQLILSK